MTESPSGNAKTTRSFRRPTKTMKRLKRSLWIFDIGFRRMNADLPAGWMPPMGVFSALTLAVLVVSVFGLPKAISFALIGCVDLLATKRFVRQSVSRIRKLGVLGVLRARWWIEMAALDLTLAMSLAVFAVTHFLDGAARPAWQFALVGAAYRSARYLFGFFLALAAAVFALGLVQGRPIRGRALELVAWFFWAAVGIVTALAVIPDNPVLANWVAPLLAILSLAVLLVAGVVAVWNRRHRQPEHPTV